jgi:hypothetical protein
VTELRLRIADLKGELGIAVPDRLGRVVYAATLGAGASVVIPDIDYVPSPVSGDGAIFVGVGFSSGLRIVLNDGTQGVTWNNTTKTLTNTVGIGRAIVAVTFKRTATPPDAVGLRYLKNSNGEVILDNLHENLEILSEGTTSVPRGTVTSLTTIPGGYPGTLLFVRWDHTVIDGIIMGNNAQILIPGISGSANIDWKVCAVNTVTNRGTGADPVMALYRGSDGVCTFSTRRKYARLRSVFAFDIDNIFVNGGSPDYFNLKTGSPIPLDCFLCVQPTFRTGSSGYVLQREAGDPTKRFAGYLSSLIGYSVSAGQATALGIPTLGSYPGAFHNTTLVINP